MSLSEKKKIPNISEFEVNKNSCRPFLFLLDMLIGLPKIVKIKIIYFLFPD